MEVSLILMKEIIMLFLILAMGMAVVKAKLMDAADSRSLSIVLVYIVIPCVIVNAFQIKYTDDVRDGLILAFAAAAVVHVIFLAATHILKKILKMDAIESATVIYSNAGILVIPLVDALMGPEYVIYSCGFIVIQLILLWTHCRGLLCGDSSISLREILKNINIISIIVGAALFVLHIELPGIIKGTLDMAGQMIGPLGMLLAGMVIADTPVIKLFAT